MESTSAILEASKSKRIGRGDADEAILVMLSLLESSVRIHDDRDLIRSAFEITADRGLTTHDAVYLALAKKVHGRLASRDKKQISVAKVA